MWKGQREWVAHNGYGMQLDKKGRFRSFFKETTAVDKHKSNVSREV